MKTLSLGKLRGLEQSATAYGALCVLALDHRGNLRNAMRPDAPDTVTTEELKAFKTDVIGTLSSAASAVLLDAEYGIPACLSSGAIAKGVGLVATLEATGYTGDPVARVSRVLPGWGAEKAKRLGATAAKLLVYYHPEAAMAKDMEKLVREVAADCDKHDLPLFLEPLSYSPDSSKKKLTPEERYQVVIETAKRLSPLGPDILKAEFPLDASEVTDEGQWLAACKELTQASAIPWVLLSATASYEVFLKQVTVACEAGASGVAVGRAVWREAATLTGQARLDFLRNTAYDRMAKITALCNALAHPWKECYSAPSISATNWYEAY
jgi:tagatose-1,6-bisphosphate aldolase